MMRTYTVKGWYYAEPDFGNDMRDAEFGPFESRAEAEKTMTSLAASGSYQRVTVVTKEEGE